MTKLVVLDLYRSGVYCEWEVGGFAQSPGQFIQTTCILDSVAPQTPFFGPANESLLSRPTGIQEKRYDGVALSKCNNNSPRNAVVLQ